MAIVVALGIAVAAGAILAAAGGVYRAWQARRPPRIVIKRPQPTAWALALPESLSDTRVLGEYSPPATVHDWLSSQHGAIDYLHTEFRVEIKSRASKPLLVRNVRARILGRRQAIDQTLVTSPSAGLVVSDLFMFDLDEDAPGARRGRREGSVEVPGETPFFEQGHVVVEPGALYEFMVRASVAATWVTWEVRIEYELGRRKKTVRLRDGETPLQTSGTPATRFRDEWFCGVMSVPGQPLVNLRELPGAMQEDLAQGGPGR